MIVRSRWGDPKNPTPEEEKRQKGKKGKKLGEKKRWFSRKGKNKGKSNQSISQERGSKKRGKNEKRRTNQPISYSQILIGGSWVCLDKFEDRQIAGEERVVCSGWTMTLRFGESELFWGGVVEGGGIGWELSNNSTKVFLLFGLVCFNLQITSIKWWMVEGMKDGYYSIVVLESFIIIVNKNNHNIVITSPSRANPV